MSPFIINKKKIIEMKRSSIMVTKKTRKIENYKSHQIFTESSYKHKRIVVKVTGVSVCAKLN